MRRHAIAIATSAVLAVGCGQYPGVHDQAVREGQIVEGQTGLTSPTEAGAVPGAAAPAGGTGQTIGPDGSTGAAPGASGGSTEAGGSATGAQGGGATGGGTTTGVTPTTIKLGLHAPLTGAAPLKAESFNRGKDAYWLKGNDGKPVEIHGRRVEVVFQDDQYNPSHARAVCQQMAEQQQVFMLVGGGGTDQIQSCGQYAASKGIPYVSVGTTEVGLSQLPTYFAVTMSYADQAPLLARYIRANQSAFGWNGQANRVAVVATNTPNFSDAVTAFQQAMPGVKVIRPSKNDRGSSMAAQLCTGTVKNYDVVFPLTSPTYFLEMAGASKCNPQYVGVGITKGLDQVAGVGCQTGGMDGARFFSPAPAFANSNEYDPMFRQAGGQDDVEFLLWGLWQSIHQLLEQAGPNLTREGFIQSSTSATIRHRVFPDAAYSSANHFGARQVSVLRADCSSGRFVTEAAFVSSF